MMRAVLRFVLMLLVGTAIFIGLPLLGWGVMDVPGFMSHPARLGYVLVMLVLQAVTVIQNPDMAQAQTQGQAKTLVKRHRISLFFLQVIPLAVVILSPFSDSRDFAAFADVALVRYLGHVLGAIGFMGMHWAAVTLANQFSVDVMIKEDHQLITSGPYRYVRHPRYLGIFVFMLGISLVFRSWLGLLLVLGLTLVLLWRVYDEEAMLRTEFGAAWEDYTQHSWRLIPFVY